MTISSATAAAADNAFVFRTTSTGAAIPARLGSSQNGVSTLFPAKRRLTRAPIALERTERVHQG